MAEWLIFWQLLLATPPDTELVLTEERLASCWIQDGETYRNRHLYLFSSDFQYAWERSATRTVVVDGQLPAAWGIH